MKNNTRVVSLVTAMAMIISSSHAFALDLNTKPQNTDRSDFETINSPFRTKDKKSSFGLEYSNTANPLVLKRNDGTTTPLIRGLDVFELSALLGLTDSLQLGILIPGERPYGIVGSMEDSRSYMGNILIEPKIYILDNVAFMPLYYIPGSTKLNTNINGTATDIDSGKDKGAYGAKLSVGFGNKEDPNAILTAVQIGAIMAPEDKFREIDQTQRLQFGAGISYPISGTIRLLLEAYGEKTKSNTPLESIATIEYKNDNFMMRVGGGTGNLQGSGSNTSKVLASFTYFFGSEKNNGNSYEAPKYDKFEDRLHDMKRKENNDPKLNDEQMEEQSGPTSGSTNLKNIFGHGLAQNDLIILPRSVQAQSSRIPMPKRLPIPADPNPVYIVSDRKRSKEDYFTLDNDDQDDQTRKPASVTVDETVAPHMTKVQWAESVRENIRIAVRLIDNNLFLYEKAQVKNDQEKMKTLETELRWGVRVYNKNMEVLKKIAPEGGTQLSFNQGVEDATALLEGKTYHSSAEVYLVSVPKAIARTQTNTAPEHVFTTLTQGSEVYVLSNQEYNGYVQIKPIGKFETFDFPLFLGKEEITKKGVPPLLAKEEAPKVQEQSQPVAETKVIEQEVKEVDTAAENDLAVDTEETTSSVDVQSALNEIEQILEDQFNQKMLAEYEEQQKTPSVPVVLVGPTPIATKEDVLVTTEVSQPMAEIIVLIEKPQTAEIPTIVEKKVEPNPVVETKAEVVAPVAEPVVPFTTTAETIKVQEEAAAVIAPVVKKQAEVKVEETKTPVVEQKAEVVAAPVVETKVEEKTVVQTPVEVKTEVKTVVEEKTVKAPATVETVKADEKAEIKAMLKTELDQYDKAHPVKKEVIATPVKAKSADPLEALINESEEVVRQPTEQKRDLVTKLPEKKAPTAVTMPEIKKDLPAQDMTKIETVVIKAEEQKPAPAIEVTNQEVIEIPVQEPVKTETKEVKKTKKVVKETTPVKETTTTTTTVVEETKSKVEAAPVAPVAEKVPETKLEVVDTVSAEQKAEVKAMLLKDEDKKSAAPVVTETKNVKTEVKETKVEIVKESPELSKLANKEDVSAQVKAENDKKADDLLKAQVEKDRMEKLKQAESKKIDEFFELKNESSKAAEEKVEVKSKSKKAVKEVVVENKEEVKVEDKEQTKEPASQFRELIKKSSDTLEEQDGMEEQNGPSFGDI